MIPSEHAVFENTYFSLLQRTSFICLYNVTSVTNMSRTVCSLVVVDLEAC